MKANHPVAFIAACMSLAIGNTDRLAALRAGGGAHGHSHPAAGHQPLRRRLHGGARGRRRAGDPLRAGGGEEGRAGGDAGGGGGARRHGRSPISPISPRASIRASSTACSWRIWSAPAPSMRWSQPRAAVRRRRRRSCAARRRSAEERGERPDRPVRRRPASRRRCACRRCRTGRRWSGWASRRRRSASI